MQFLRTGRTITHRVGRLGHRVANYFRPKGLVLMYHRVAETKVDPWKLSVSPHHFRRQIEYLRSEANVVRLLDYAQALREGRLPRRAVIITFDDGYADNLLEAAPVLVDAGLPATFFITTGAVGQNGEFWWDDLERCLLGDKSCSISELEEALSGAMPAGAMPPEKEGMRRFADRAEPTSGTLETKSRLATYDCVWKQAASLTPDSRRCLVAQIRAATNTPLMARPTHRTMTKNELISLSRLPGMEVGAHTISHTPLTVLSKNQKRREITGSCRWLEEVLGTSVSAFSYPNGMYDEEAIALLKQEGFSAGCTTEAAPVDPRTPSLTLPRVHVPDVDVDGFHRLIRRYL